MLSPTIFDPVLHQREQKQSTRSSASVPMDETTRMARSQEADLLDQLPASSEAAAATTATTKKKLPKAGPGKPPRSERKPRHRKSGNKQKQQQPQQQEDHQSNQQTKHPQPQPQRLGKKPLRQQLKKRQLEQQQAAAAKLSPAERFLQRAQAIASCVPEAVHIAAWPPSCEQLAGAADADAANAEDASPPNCVNVHPHQHQQHTTTPTSTTTNATPPSTTTAQQQQQQEKRIQIITSCLSPQQLQQQRLPQQQQHDDNTTTTTTIRIYVKPLLVLDLNGILCHRIRRPRRRVVNGATAPPPPPPLSAHYRPAAAGGRPIATTPVVPRPHLAAWLDFLNRHFCLAIWTSGKNKTARALVQALVDGGSGNSNNNSIQFLFVWAQHHCIAQLPPSAMATVGESDSTTTTDANGNAENGSNSNSSSNNNNNNTPISIANIHPSEIVYQKDLGRVWREFPLWNAGNTVMVDDSPDKCAGAWRQNAVHPPPLNGLLRRARARARNQQEQQQQQSMNDDSNDNDKTMSPQGTGNCDTDGDHVLQTSDDSNNGEEILQVDCDDDDDDDDDEANVARQQIFFERLVQHWKDHPVVHEWDAAATVAAVASGSSSGGRRDDGGLAQFLREHAAGHMGWEA